jgi:hypothetical protein
VQGRAFTDQEVDAGTAVIVLGWELAEKLFAGREPLGREVRIARLPYRVIGVVERQGNLLGLSLDKFAIVPASSPAKRIVNAPGEIDALPSGRDPADSARPWPEPKRSCPAGATCTREENDFALGPRTRCSTSGPDQPRAVPRPAGLVAVSLVVVRSS